MNDNKLTDEDLWVRYMLVLAVDHENSVEEDGDVADQFVYEFNIRFRQGKNNERTE